MFSADPEKRLVIKPELDARQRVAVVERVGGRRDNKHVVLQRVGQLRDAGAAEARRPGTGPVGGA